ncbi:hypothetical protein ACFOEZ_14995 [Tianweitania populi]|uniref:Uncharacterized protein n=1 Tax=Tianweitania populi TaxID=1607949 RepID=A0A8J3DW74_9HYPH|nr:hypothetical protein [Tianweitania populi]GHD16552.1 hypothetical protein GCM10016234_24810 [Tianweitania populi]
MAGRSSFGFLGRFGRSADLRAFDEGLRRCDVHPAQVVDGVKLAAVRLVQKHGKADSLPDRAYEDAAALVAFTVLGEGRMAELLGQDLAETLAARVERAADCPDGLDAELILLALHTGLVAPHVADAFGLSIDEG